MFLPIIKKKNKEKKKKKKKKKEKEKKKKTLISTDLHSVRHSTLFITVYISFLRRVYYYERTQFWLIVYTYPVILKQNKWLNAYEDYPEDRGSDVERPVTVPHAQGSIKTEEIQACLEYWHQSKACVAVKKKQQFNVGTTTTTTTTKCRMVRGHK